MVAPCVAMVDTLLNIVDIAWRWEHTNISNKDSKKSMPVYYSLFHPLIFVKIVLFMPAPRVELG